MPSIKNQFLHISLYPTETPNVLKKKGKGTEYINLVQEHRNKICACVKCTHTLHHNFITLHTILSNLTHFTI